MPRAAAILPVMLIALLPARDEWPRSRRAQEPHCDAQLSPPPGDSYGYRLRGDRCEGVYAREVGGGVELLLASLTESFEDVDPARANVLRLAWTAPGGAPVRLRAYSLRRRLYYRMDSRRPAGDTSYAWPTGLLRTLGLTRQDIGVVVWAALPVGETTRDVHLPLRVRGPGREAQPARLQMTILPAAELTELFVSVATVRPDGSPGAYLERDRPLRYGFYPADRGIRVQLPAVKAPGMYVVELGASLRDGGATTNRFWLYHPGA